jgi:hypothetical protein
MLLSLQRWSQWHKFYSIAVTRIIMLLSLQRWSQWHKFYSIAVTHIIMLLPLHLCCQWHLLHNIADTYNNVAATAPLLPVASHAWFVYHALLHTLPYARAVTQIHCGVRSTDILRLQYQVCKPCCMHSLSLESTVMCTPHIYIYIYIYILFYMYIYVCSVVCWICKPSCTHTSVFLSRYTISIDMKTWVSDFWNRYEIKLLGVSMSPCVKRFCGP